MRNLINNILKEDMGISMAVYDAFVLYGQALASELEEKGYTIENARNGTGIWYKMRNAKINGLFDLCICLKQFIAVVRIN